MERQCRGSMSTGGTNWVVHRCILGLKKSGFQIFSNQDFRFSVRGCFQKKSWVVVILLFKELSLMRSHSLRIEDRRMRFSPLLRKFDVVIIPSKKDQNRPTQSWDTAWNVRSKTENPSSFPLLGMGKDLAQTVLKLVSKKMQKGHLMRLRILFPSTP